MRAIKLTRNRKSNYLILPNDKDLPKVKEILDKNEFDYIEYELCICNIQHYYLNDIVVGRYKK